MFYVLDTRDNVMYAPHHTFEGAEKEATRKNIYFCDIAEVDKPAEDRRFIVKEVR